MHVAGRPAASNVGTRFHNFLYAELDLDFVYKAFTTTDLAAAVAGIRALGIRGCGVSMPYKEACPSSSTSSTAGRGDRVGEHDREHRRAVARPTTPTTWPSPSSWPTGGSRRTTASPCSAAGAWPGGAAALRDAGFHTGTVIARNARTGTALAERYGYAGGPRSATAGPSCWSTPPRSGCRWSRRRRPAGGAGGGRRRRDRPGRGRGAGPDLAGAPGPCPGAQVITGAEVIALQAVEQFVLYTGVRPSDDQVRRASELSRA